MSAAETRSPLDSDDLSDVEEAQEKLLLETLEAELSSNPFNYDAHAQYIKILRKGGQIEKMRRAREAMSALFPLTPEMWQEWLKDEVSLSNVPEAFPTFEKLYERAILDYLSVSLWVDYVNFVQEHDPAVRGCSAAGISKIRNLFEQALIAVGLHVTEGSKIWEAYREFEQAIYYTIDDTDAEAKEKQVQRIRSTFHRQLSVPLSDNKSTFLAYKSWEVEQGNSLDANSSDFDGLPANVASAYQNSLGMYNARISFEEQVSRKDMADAERLQQFKEYIKFEQSSGDPTRVRILYERAIAEFPISSDLWQEYTRYMDRTLKLATVTVDIYSRATKNCPWVGELWVQYLLCLERRRASEKDMSSVFERALQCTFSSLEEYLDLFLTRVDGLRRRMSMDHEGDVLNYGLIKDTFQKASDYLSPHLKNTDDLLRLHAYWARLELMFDKNTVAAREVWEKFLKMSGSMLEAWKGYIAMELELGNINEARSIFRRCYSRRFPGVGSEDICKSWLCFEREFGTLEDYDHAVQKVTPRLEELQLFNLQQESQVVVADQRQSTHKKSSREKRKSASYMGDQPATKKHKEADKNLEKTFEKDNSQAQTSLKLNEVHAGVEKSGDLNGQETKESMPSKTKLNRDQCTAYISNLSLQATYEDLQDFFSDIGGVASIRILKDKFTGKSRGLAYVDFVDDEHLSAAISKNKRKLLGKKASVARSDPAQRRKKEPKGLNSHVEPGKAGDHDRGTDIAGPHESSSSEPRSRRDGGVPLKGKNTFAMPRSVRPLGWTADKPKPAEEVDEKPKSNEEFRKMLLKG